jgi:hypothetical protein
MGITGKIKISYIVEIVRDKTVNVDNGTDAMKSPLQTLMMPKPVMDFAQQRNALLSIVQQAKSQQAAGSVMNADEVEDVYFPVLAVIHRIQVFSLDSVHRFSKNSPYVSITCDDWAASTVVRRPL